MNQFRCKICGKTAPTVPRVCECGNGSPALWETVPDGAAAQDALACAIVGANDYSPLRNGHNAAAAPGRPNN